MNSIDKVYYAVVRGYATSTEISKHTGISLEKVSAYLTVLRKRGEIELTGRTKRRKFREGPRSNIYMVK